jgi:hypothetical protein
MDENFYDCPSKENQITVNRYFWWQPCDVMMFLKLLKYY